MMLVVLIRFYETGSVKPGSIGGTKPKVELAISSSLISSPKSLFLKSRPWNPASKTCSLLLWALAATKLSFNLNQVNFCAASGHSVSCEKDHPTEDGQPRWWKRNYLTSDQWPGYKTCCRYVCLGDQGAAALPEGVWPRLHPLRLLHQQDPQAILHHFCCMFVFLSKLPVNMSFCFLFKKIM